MRLEATGNLKKLISGYYSDLKKYADSGKPIAWVNVGIPCEIFYAMDIFPFYVENYGAMLGARKEAVKYSKFAETDGVSKHTCSYLRSTYGSLLSKEGPIGKLPEPTILVETSNSCVTVLSWWRLIEKATNAPCFLFDSPMVEYESSGNHLAYQVSETKRMIRFLEEKTGKRFDLNRLKEVVKISNEGKRLWRETMELRTNHPSPLTGADLFTHMFPMVALRGTEQYLEHLRMLYKETKERIKRKEFPVAKEKHRFLWDNLPIWHDLRLFEELAKKGINFVTDTYTQAWGDKFMGEVSLDDPIKGLAYYTGGGFLNVHIKKRLAVLLDIIKLYDVDGVVFHADRSCKSYSLIQVQLADQLRQNGIPSIIIEADHNDTRDYNRDSIIARIETLSEMGER